MQAKIGYIPIDYFKTNKPKVCEAPRHQDLLFPISAFAVIAIQSNDYPDGLVQMVCKACWEIFDCDMNHPKWNLIEMEKDTQKL